MAQELLTAESQTAEKPINKLLKNTKKLFLDYFAGGIEFRKSQLSENLFTIRELDKENEREAQNENNQELINRNNKKIKFLKLVNEYITKHKVDKYEAEEEINKTFSREK